MLTVSVFEQKRFSIVKGDDWKRRFKTVYASFNANNCKIEK